MVFPVKVLVRTFAPLTPFVNAPVTTLPKGCPMVNWLPESIVNDHPEAPIRLAPTGSVALATVSKAPFVVLITTVYVFKVPAALTPDVPLLPELAAVPLLPLVPLLPSAEVPLLPLLPDVPAVAFTPDVPLLPDVEDVPELPDDEAVPLLPLLPEVPALEEVPLLPDTPAVPDVP